MSSFSLNTDKQDTYNRIFNADSFSILTSIGIHLLLLGGLIPGLWKISSDSQPREPQRTVGVVELNPIEQSRLPNLSPTPEVPSVPSVPNIPAFDSSSIPDLSSLNPSTSLPSLPSIPSLPPLPPISSSPSVGIYSPPVPSVSIPRTQSYLPPAPSYIPEPPSNLNLEPAKPRPITQPQFDPFKDTLDLEKLRRAPVNASQAEQLRNQQERENPSQTAIVPRTQTAPNLANQDAINAERRRRLLSEVLEGSTSVQQDPSNTTDEEVKKNYFTWLKKVPNEQLEVKTVAGIYPRAACSRKIEGTSVYGVTVNPQGIITGTPYLIRSAGYPILNQRAFQTVRGLNFQNASGQLKSYQVNVSYKYDPSICPGSTQPLPQNPVETRVNPPQAPALEAPKPLVTPKPQNQSPVPETTPQAPANPTPDNVRVNPPSPANPDRTPSQPQGDNLLNAPTGNPKPEDLIPQNPTGTAPETPVIQQPVTVPKPQPTVEPNPVQPVTPASPTLDKPDIEPPSPPTSKKPEP